MKRLKKNRIITPLLITLTGILVAVGSFLLLRQQDIATKPEQSAKSFNPPVLNETQKHSTKRQIRPVEKFCWRQRFEEKSYVICQVNPEMHDISLFLNDPHGEPFKYFRNVEKFLHSHGKRIAFAVNGGMYHKDYSAVGLYIENGNMLHNISTRDGPGNFHMKPNGIFFIANKKAGVMDTDSYLKNAIKPELATQSGPMLVVRNKIHPRFIPNSPYREYRNGVGVREDGTVLFVNSEERVNFEELARFFRDDLKTPNALFLDGSISSLYAPELKRYDWWYALGPIIAITLQDDPQNNASKLNNEEYSRQ